MIVRGRGVARAFDERLLLFSRQQTLRNSGRATRPQPRPGAEADRAEPVQNSTLTVDTDHGVDLEA